MGNRPLNLMSVEDVGDVLMEVLARGKAFLNKTLSLSGDKLTIHEMAALLSRVLDPKYFKDRQVAH